MIGRNHVDDDGEFGVGVDSAVWIVRIVIDRWSDGGGGDDDDRSRVSVDIYKALV